MRFNLLCSIAALSASIAGCGSDPGAGTRTDPVSSDNAPLVTTISAVNEWKLLPSSRDYYCHTTRMAASGGHSQSIIYKWGVPATGAVFGGDVNAINAFPNNGQSPYVGTARHDVQCDSWFNFHGNSSASIRYDGGLTWSDTGQLEFVSGSVGTYFQDSVCGIEGINSLSDTGEKAELDVTSNQWLYTLNVSGFRVLSGSARCAWLGRPLTGQQWVTATPNNPGYSTISAYGGICLIEDVEGNLDDGAVAITGNPLALEVQGDVSRARAMCFPY